MTVVSWSVSWCLWSYGIEKKITGGEGKVSREKGKDSKEGEPGRGRLEERGEGEERTERKGKGKNGGGRAGEVEKENTKKDKGGEGGTVKMGRGQYLYASLNYVQLSFGVILWRLFEHSNI